MARYGYVRVSTDDQDLALQLDALRCAGVPDGNIFRDTASGARSHREGLDQVWKRLQSGDELVIWRLDRLGRSIDHVRRIVQDLHKRGIALRSLRESFETDSAAGEFQLNLFAALSHMERRLISERTRAGLAAARNRGAKLGNPEVAQRSTMRAHLRAVARQQYFRRLNASEAEWWPYVRRFRPEASWAAVAGLVNANLPTASRQWSSRALRNAAKAYVDAGRADPTILEPARSARSDDAADRAARLIARLRALHPEDSLRDLAGRLEALGEPTPRGGARWHASSVRAALRRAAK